MIKITWHIKLGKRYTYKPRWHQNHDTKQAIEKQRETEIKINNLAKPSVDTSS